MREDLYFRNTIIICIYLKGDCVVNLDGLKGKHPPLLIQDGVFKYPTSETERNLGFSKYLDDHLICVHGSSYSLLNAR